MEQKQINNNDFIPKEKNFTLNNFLSKLNKTETTRFGNYSVNFKEMFKNEKEYKDYFKKHVSLFNDDPIFEGKKLSNESSFQSQKYLDNFDEKTLFYIFYYMPRDTMQLFAGANLYKKGWVFNHKNQIWFKKNKDGEKWIYFNPLEWKKNEYNFGPVDLQHFMHEEEAYAYLKIFERGHKNKKKQGHKSGNNNSKTSNNNHSNSSQNNNVGNANQKNEQKDNNNNNNSTNNNNNNNANP